MSASNKKQLVAITIPVYKEVPDENELVSLKQCLNVLKDHPVILFAPKSLNVNYYREVFGSKRLMIERFNDSGFKSIAGYNRLLLSSKFYKRFQKFTFILIYQLDCFVFSDELTAWCNAGYDYIGAPWFEDWDNATLASHFIGVGNGGFSLRNTKSHLKALNSFSYIVPFSKLLATLRMQKFSLSAAKQLLLNLTVYNNTFSLFNNYQDHEDIFWGIVIPGKFKAFKVPGMEVASRFSMEVNAPLLYRLNNNHLPFGCHAWGKYYPLFWRNFIKVD